MAGHDEEARKETMNGVEEEEEEKEEEEDEEERHIASHCRLFRQQ